jgi:hypothetical protein
VEVYERLERLRRRAELERRLLHAAADTTPSSGHAAPESLSSERRAGEDPSPESKALDFSVLLDVGLGIIEQDIVEPDIGWLVAVEPEAVESDAVESEAVGSDAVGSEVVGSEVVGSDAVEPEAVESEAEASGIAESGIAEPDTIELARLPIAADADSPQSPETVETSLPIPLTQMVNEVLAALRPALQRYPGLIVGVWPPGRAAEDLNAAIRFTLDAATGLSLRMPDTGSSDTGSSDTGSAGDEHQDAGSPAPRSVAVELASLLRNGLSDR